jgi:hypothetical protein
MERKTALQATGVFVVTVLAGLPFALQVGEWIGGPDGAPSTPLPAATEMAPPPGDEPAAAEPDPRGGTGAGPAPAGGTPPESSPEPRRAKAGPVPGLPESTPAVPGEPAPEPTGGPGEEPAEPPPAEPTGDPEEPEEPDLPAPTLPVATVGAPPVG